MSYQLRVAVRTHPGLKREQNEDSYYVGPRLLVVADGMGGHAAGEVASAITAEHFAQIDQTALDHDLYIPLTAAIDSSNEAIAAAVDKDPALAGMGTTATAVLFGDKRIAVANVGDSRAYLYQSDRAALIQLTSDDSFVQMLVDAGEISAEQALHHPYRSVVVKSVNGAQVKPRFTSLVRIYGDRYLVCSDGLTDFVDIADIETAIRIADPAECADRLIALTLDAGAPDNVTVIVADLVAAQVSSTELGSAEQPHSEIHTPATKPIPIP